MAEKKPLVWYDDTQLMEELRAGDTIPGATGEDDNSGRYYVPTGAAYTVEQYYQSITKIMLDLVGDLFVDGQYFVEN